MGTLRQKKLAEEIVKNLKREKPLNKGQLLERVRYGKVSKQPSRVFESIGVKEELGKLGFNEYSAKKVVRSIMLDEDVDPSARLKATDQVFKVQGSYAPEKSLNININATSEHRALSKEAVNQFLSDHTGNS